MTRTLKLKLEVTHPEDYISRFCSKLRLSGEVQAKVTKILRGASDKELISGRGPIGITAAAIYMAAILCDERRTQKEITVVTCVTEVTIRNRYKELQDKLGITIQP